MKKYAYALFGLVSCVGIAAPGLAQAATVAEDFERVRAIYEPGRPNFRAQYVAQWVASHPSAKCELVSQLPDEVEGYVSDIQNVRLTPSKVYQFPTLKAEAVDFQKSYALDYDGRFYSAVVGQIYSADRTAIEGQVKMSALSDGQVLVGELGVVLYDGATSEEAKEYRAAPRSKLSSFDRSMGIFRCQ